eukprot:TRINITY_DN9155_c0_g1_i1.p1 TRINITY_DN9155_c0_g1~~TRINITY_DN9155_c0_g1_i1.p1  ORF type:complete len:223 (+),score=52.74 TRINITY_DN9155_c0_g1_i1:49-717(+)
MSEDDLEGVLSRGRSISLPAEDNNYGLLSDSVGLKSESFSSPEVSKYTLKRREEKEKDTFQKCIQLRLWLENYLDTQLGSEDLPAILKDGVVLCDVISKIAPAKAKKVKPSKDHFKRMANVQTFLNICKDIGVKSVFTPEELVLGTNIPGVLACLFELRDKATGTIRATRVTDPELRKSREALEKKFFEGSSNDEVSTLRARNLQLEAENLLLQTENTRLKG